MPSARPENAVNHLRYEVFHRIAVGWRSCELIPLSKSRSVCDMSAMNRFRLIGRLLAVFVIVGLVTAPMVTSAATRTLSTHEASDASTMPADMACCPGTQKSDGCQDCPLRATCALGVTQIEPPLATGILAPLFTRRSFSVLDDLVADGLDGSPPDQPPRILA